MAPPTWRTPEQVAFMERYKDEYVSHMNKGRLKAFFPPVFAQWEKEFPQRRVALPSKPFPMPLTEADLKVLEASKLELQHVRHSNLPRCNH